MKLVLREKRERIPLTQQEMADMMNMALRTYQRIEQGIRKPNCDAVIALQNFFGKSIDHLLAQVVNTKEPDRSQAEKRN